MLYPLTGTSVPKSLDSPQGLQNLHGKFTHDPPRVPRVAVRSPVLAVTLRHLGQSTFECVVMKKTITPKVYRSVSPTNAKRLLRLIQDYSILQWCEVTPFLTGWTAYIDKPVYPPPGDAKAVQNV